MKNRIMLLFIFLLAGIFVNAQGKDKSTEQIAKERANKIANEVSKKIENMTFEEFEAFANSSPYAGQFTRAELKKDYNKMHKNDGKAVKIYPKDYEQPQEMKMLKAMDAMETAQTYEEFKRYVKIVNPTIKEEDIRKLWESELKKREKKKQRQKNSKRKKAKAQKKGGKAKKKDISQLATERRNNNNDADDSDFDLGDLLGSSKNKKKGNKTSDNNGFDLGGIMDAMESDEAAELGKKMKEVDVEQAEANVSKLESMLQTEEDFYKLGGMTNKQAKALAVARQANQDPSVSVSERERKLREYYRAFGSKGGKLEDFAVAQSINLDSQKIKKQHKIKKEKEGRKEKKKTPDEIFKKQLNTRLDVEEFAISYMIPSIEERYGKEVVENMSKEDLYKLTIEFGNEVAKYRGRSNKTLEKCLDVVVQRYLLK